MKRFLIILTFFCAMIIGAVFIVAIPKAEKNIQAAINDLGFKTVQIEGTEFNLTGITIEHISLDNDGFNSISNLKANIFWPQYLFKSKINAIWIEEIKFSAVPSDMRYVLKKIGTTSKNISIENIEVSKIIFDLAVSNYALRFEGNINIKNEDNGQKLIKANIFAQQYELSFNSEWSGTIDASTNNVEIDSIIEDLKINLQPLALNRGNGWLSYISKDNESTLSAQLDTGNGEIFSIPAKNISLIVGQDKAGYPVMFRANMAGIDNVQFTSDIHYAHNPAERKFSATLQIPDKNQFFDYLKTQNIISKNTETPSSNIKQIDTLLSYMPDKRFADGPLPFDISVKADFKDNLSGTFLIYPDSFDIRGTTEANTDMLDILNALISIPKENIADNVIRLDRNLKSLMN